MNGTSVIEVQATESSGLVAPAGVRARLREQFDAVVMLTWSNWKTEPRSNRYHFATRFAEVMPVVFAQPILHEDDYYFEATSVANLTLLHVPDRVLYDARSQIAMLGAALNEKGIRRPLLWVYNAFLHDFMRVCYSPLKVYHATEDYFDPHLHVPARTIHLLKSAVREADLVVSVTKGVADSYQQHTQGNGRWVVACNGVDYRYYAATDTTPAPASPRKVALYQGGINWRLDLDLMRATMQELPDWDLVIAGRIHFGESDQARWAAWQKLLAMPNCRYLGELSIADLREQMRGATVGLIPFANLQSTREASLPLKAFEYVACGLPVVSVPLTELQNHAFGDVFTFAETAEQFAECIRDSAAARFDAEKLRRREAAARGVSYDQTFDLVCRSIVETPKQAARRALPLTILVLHGSDRAFDEQLLNGQQRSRHRMYAAVADGQRDCPYDLGHFNCVVVDSCLSRSGRNGLSAAYRKALQDHPGLKVLLGGVGGNEEIQFMTPLGIQDRLGVGAFERVEELLGQGMEAPCGESVSSAPLPEPPPGFRTPPLRLRQRVRRIVVALMKGCFGKAVTRTVMHSWIPKLMQAATLFNRRLEA